MRTAASALNLSLARLWRWLYVRAIALGLSLVLLACYLVGGPAKTEARPTAAAHAPAAQGAAFVSAARPPLLGSGQFGGLTSKGWPVVLRVSRRGDRVRRAVAGIEFNCTSGASFAVNDEWRALPIRRRHFGDSVTGTTTGAGLVYQHTSTISGRMNRKGSRIAGTWRNTMVERNALGAVQDTCDTGRLRFTVSR